MALGYLACQLRLLGHDVQRTGQKIYGFDIVIARPRVFCGLRQQIDGLFMQIGRLIVTGQQGQ